MSLFGWKGKARPDWRFVGTVEAPCVQKYDDGSELGLTSYINLYETEDGRRRYEVIGALAQNTSPASRFAHAQVLGWEAGGPLPPLYWCEDQGEDNDHTAELIVFPGGKDGAA